MKVVTAQKMNDVRDGGRVSRLDLPLQQKLHMIIGIASFIRLDIHQSAVYEVILY